MSAPGSSEFIAELAARNAAAEAWIANNITMALVVPLSVAKDLFPNGFGQIEADAVISKVLPGESVESVDRSPDCLYLRLKP